MRRFVFGIGLVCLCVAAPSVGARQQPATDLAYTANGFMKDRDYFSGADFEHVDTLNGNLMLTFTDLVLPGNAGMDLRFQRTYAVGGATANGSWRFGLAGLPMTIEFPDGPLLSTTPPLYPIAITSDGAKHHMRPENYPSQQSFTSSFSPEFWRYRRSGSSPNFEYTLEMPNGYVLKYLRHGGTVQSISPVYLEEVHDPFGNWIQIDWTSSSGNSPRLAVVYQGPFANDMYRIISFTYQSASDTLPWTMTFDNRVWQYDPPMRPETVTSPAGTTWHFGYTDDTTKVTTPFGGELEYEFGVHAFSRDTWLDPVNNSYIYTNTRVLKKRRVLAGHDLVPGEWTYDYDVPGYNTKITFPDGRWMGYFYGELVSRVQSDAPFAAEMGLWDRKLFEPGGTSPIEHEHLEYEHLKVGIQEGTQAGFAAALKKREVTRTGRTFVTTHQYAATRFGDYHNPEVTTEGGRTIGRAYNHSFGGRWIRGRPTSETVSMDGESFTTSRVYDDEGFVRSETRYGVQTNFTPDGNGNVGTTTDAHQHVSEFTYNWGTLKNTKTPKSFWITREIYPDGLVASETRNGATTTFTYDGAGRPRVLTPPRGFATVTEYPDGSHVVVRRGLASTTYSVDGMGRVIGSEDTNHVKTSRGYDVFGRTTFASLPHAGNAVGTWTEYDRLDRVAKRTQSNSQVTEFEYSDGVDVTIKEHNVSEHTGAETRTTFQDWAAFGDPSDARLVRLVDARAQEWRYEYNALGRLRKVIQPGGTVREWHYPADSDRVEWESHPESGTTSYDYAGQRLSKKTTAKGAIDFAYDANDRLTFIDAHDGEHNVSFDYDDADNRIWMQNATVSSTFKFDPANRLEWRKDESAGQPERKTTYTYFDSDDVDTLTYPSGNQVNYTYDGEGRVKSVRRGGTAIAEVLEYHPSGAIQKLRMGNGQEETFAFDDNSYWLKQISGGPLSMRYKYDLVGNVTTVDDFSANDFDQTFSYDHLDRLEQVNGFGFRSFTYDALGNRQSKSSPSVTYEYDLTAKRLVRVNGPQPNPEVGDYRYEGADGAVGNLTSDPTTSLYQYTPFNMVRRATVSGSDTNYAYDGDNVRMKRTNSSVGTEWFYHVGGRLVSTYRQEPGQTAASWVRDSVYLGDRPVANLFERVATISVVSSSSSISEGGSGGNPSVTVRIVTGGSPLQTPASVNWTTANGTASAGSDYVAASGTVTFPVNTVDGATQTVQVTIIGDVTFEPDETFNVNLSNAQNARLGAASHTVTIIDDEPQPLASIDTLVQGGAHYPPFAVSGWAFDGRGTASTGVGVDALQVWAHPVASGADIYLGQAPFVVGQRPDVAQTFQKPWLVDSGYGLTVGPGALAEGQYVVYLRGHFTRNNTWVELPPHVTINIQSQLMYLESPAQNSSTITGQPFYLSGWAIDRQASSGSGFGFVHVWAYSLDGLQPVFLGQVFPDARQYIANMFGQQFLMSGFRIPAAMGLAPGRWEIRASAWSTVDNTFNQSASAWITIPIPNVFVGDAPAANATVSQPFHIGGWAIDLASPNTNGLAAMHVYAFSSTGQQITLGQVPVASERADLAALHGEHHRYSGWGVNASGLAPGTYTIGAFPVSTGNQGVPGWILRVVTVQ